MKAILLLGVLLFGLPANWAAGIPDAEEHQESWLWHLGDFDDSSLEFKLAPNLSGQYSGPGIHVAGITDPSHTWPYILPGKLDSWAGPGSRTFEVLFHIKDIRVDDECSLVLDFLDTHSAYPPLLEVKVNETTFMHQSPAGKNDWTMSAEDGTGKEHKAVFSLPFSTLRKGENHIQITSVEGSWAIWDALGIKVSKGVKRGKVESDTRIRSVRQRQLLKRGIDTLLQPLELEILHLGDIQEAVLKADGLEAMEVSLEPGINRIELWIPESRESRDVDLELASKDKLLAKTSVVVVPVRHWEVHLIHQTHLDIGFTHTQEEVLEMQTGYLHQALDLIDETADLPEEARFRWHPEGMWAIDEFLRTADTQDSLRFMKALREQSIHLDAFYVHLLTGLASGEELMELLRPAKSFEEKYGIPVRTAIGSDVPGYSWGLVTSLADQGIRFLNMAPNNNYKLGYLYHWADRPFFWSGPDGHSKVLAWMASHAYIYFWNQNEGLYRVPRFLDYLINKDFPYDIAMLRYEIGGDNGHPDPTLPYKVKEWNETYAYPKIIISTNSRLYDSFTGKYQDDIPTYSGDLTPYWEDGAASTAADLALNRESGERLLQYLALEAITRTASIRQEEIHEAWNKIIMYDEHTWGAYCSKSDPYDPFTISQERYKQQFALDGHRMVSGLGKKILMDLESRGSGSIDVINTSSWKRSGIVMLSREQSTSGDRIRDDRGKVLLSQRLQTGELAFYAEDIPGFGSRRFTIMEGDPETSHNQGVKISKEAISNEFLHVSIDKVTGSVSGIYFPESDCNLVDTSFHQLNDYLYVEGRVSAEGIREEKGPASIQVEEAGPLLGVLRIESSAPGCIKLSKRIRVVAGRPGVEIINRVEKEKNLDPEGVYFSFPLNIPDGMVHMDIPWGVMRPEKDQLPGANRNYYPIQRWMDISNENYGMTWVTRDAPMVKFSPMELVGKGRGDSEHMAEFEMEGVRSWWRPFINPGQSFYSWVMNNHWEVNYKAFQEGAASFAYYLVPHRGSYRGDVAEKMAREFCQPLIALEADPAEEAKELPFELSGEQLIVSSLSVSEDGSSYRLRLYNPLESTGRTRIISRSGQSIHIRKEDPENCFSQEGNNLVELPGFGVLSLEITRTVEY